MFSIMVAEDDPVLNRMVCSKLRLEGFDPVPALDGAQALALTRERHVDLVVTDIMMPGLDGNRLVAELRAWKPGLPVLVMTARGGLEDMAETYGLGADDYMVKPVNLAQLMLHVKALLRRARVESERRLVVGGTVLDFDTLTLSRAGSRQELPPKEFQLLFKLASNAGRIYTRLELLEEIWGPESDANERNVDAHIKKLRRRLEGNPDLQIVTVRGLGYKALAVEAACDAACGQGEA